MFSTLHRHNVPNNMSQTSNAQVYLSVFVFVFQGGHPHNWNAISKECLSLLADLTQRLVAYHDTVATNGRAKSLSTGSERTTSSDRSGMLSKAQINIVVNDGSASSFTSYCLFFLKVISSGTEELMSPRPTLMLKTPASLFARSIVGTPQSPLTAPFTSELDSPFTSPGLRRFTAPVEQCSPWHGTVQSPHVMRRAPKLWSTSTGERS